jgi:hypothetical protein
VEIDATPLFLQAAEGMGSLGKTDNDDGERKRSIHGVADPLSCTMQDVICDVPQFDIIVNCVKLGT